MGFLVAVAYVLAAYLVVSILLVAVDALFNRDGYQSLVYCDFVAKNEGFHNFVRRMVSPITRPTNFLLSRWRRRRTA